MPTIQYSAIFLPGNSFKNKIEMDIISDALEKSGEIVYRHSWNHWGTVESSPLDIDLEIQTIDQNLNKNIIDNPILVAKSIGTLVALKLTLVNISPKLIILMGIPVNDLDENDKAEYRSLLGNINVPVYLIHNKNDNHGNVQQVEELLKGMEYQLIIKESDDHKYVYPEDVLNIVSNAA